MSPVSSSVISTVSQKTCLRLNPMEPVRVTVGKLEFVLLLGLELGAIPKKFLGRHGLVLFAAPHFRVNLCKLEEAWSQVQPLGKKIEIRVHPCSSFCQQKTEPWTVLLP
jgi:hypothetical protein